MHKFSLGIALLMFAIALVAPCPSEAGTALDVKMMKMALRAIDQEENGFLEHVSDLVVQDVLPRSMVESTFLWARKKPDNKFQYFKRGLKVRAAKIGVKL